MSEVHTTITPNVIGSLLGYQQIAHTPQALHVTHKKQGTHAFELANCGVRAVDLTYWVELAGYSFGMSVM